MKALFGILIVIVVALAVALFLALPVMWLWNSLIPNIFGFPSITFWQSLGLCILTRFLFGTGTSSSSE